jgi:hypothetical protein
MAASSTSEAAEQFVQQNWSLDYDVENVRRMFTTSSRGLITLLLYTAEMPAGALWLHRLPACRSLQRMTRGPRCCLLTLACR